MPMDTDINAKVLAIENAIYNGMRELNREITIETYTVSALRDGIDNCQKELEQSSQMTNLLEEEIKLYEGYCKQLSMYCESSRESSRFLQEQTMLFEQRLQEKVEENNRKKNEYESIVESYQKLLESYHVKYESRNLSQEVANCKKALTNAELELTTSENKLQELSLAIKRCNQISNHQQGVIDIITNIAKVSVDTATISKEIEVFLASKKASESMEPCEKQQETYTSQESYQTRCFQQEVHNLDVLITPEKLSVENDNSSLQSPEGFKWKDVPMRTTKDDRNITKLNDIPQFGIQRLLVSMPKLLQTPLISSRTGASFYPPFRPLPTLKSKDFALEDKSNKKGALPACEVPCYSSAESMNEPKSLEVVQMVTDDGTCCHPLNDGNRKDDSNFESHVASLENAQPTSSPLDFDTALGKLHKLKQQNCTPEFTVTHRPMFELGENKFLQSTPTPATFFFDSQLEERAITPFVTSAMPKFCGTGFGKDVFTREIEPHFEKQPTSEGVSTVADNSLSRPNKNFASLFGEPTTHPPQDMGAFNFQFGNANASTSSETINCTFSLF